MVFENATVFPTPEGEQKRCPPPSSTYGFQKLACEYFAQGAREQYGLPYTVLRPFNCVGIGEGRARTDQNILSGNVSLALSHVVPDLVQKVLKARIRCISWATAASGVTIRTEASGRAIVLSWSIPGAERRLQPLDRPVDDGAGTGGADLAQNPGDRPLRTVSDPPYAYDVQRREPDVTKTRTLLGFEATTSLESVLDEVIPGSASRSRRAGSDRVQRFGGGSSRKRARRRPGNPRSPFSKSATSPRAPIGSMSGGELPESAAPRARPEPGTRSQSAGEPDRPGRVALARMPGPPRRRAGAGRSSPAEAGAKLGAANSRKGNRQNSVT